MTSKGALMLLHGVLEKLQRATSGLRELPLQLRDVPASTYLLLAMCIALGQAVQMANGALSPAALHWLAFAAVSGLLVPLLGGVRLEGALAEHALLLLAGGGLLLQFTQLVSSSPGFYLSNLAAHGPERFYAGLVAAAILAGLGLCARPPLGQLGAVALVTSFLIVGRWMLAVAPAPQIDVFVFQRDGAQALWEGHNPYSLRYPDIYLQSPYYGPGLSVGGQLQFGYPYYPLSLLLVLPAHLIAGDFRVAHLLAVAFFGLVIMTLRPSPVARAAGALFLFTPRSLFVLEQGWTEPLVLAMLGLVALAAQKRPAMLPWALGLLLAVKQYSVFMVPLALLLLPRQQRTWRGVGAFALKAALPGLLITLPFVIAHPRDFWFDVVKLQLLQPFRPDALSFLAWWFTKYGTQLSTVWPFVAAMAALGLCLWRLPRGLSGFVGGVALVYFFFFALNKQAFCNYYYLVIGVSALAAALAAPRESSAALGAR